MSITTKNIPMETAEALISASPAESLNGLRRVKNELLRMSRTRGCIYRVVAETPEDGRFWAYQYELVDGEIVLGNDPTVEAREVFAVQRSVTCYESLPSSLARAAVSAQQAVSAAEDDDASGSSVRA